MQFDGDESIASATGAVALPAASFGALKQIDAGVLSVSYAEAGPPDGSPVILLHGWPYDIHTYVDVAPYLAAKGYRVIVPSLRGYGSTRFLSPGAARNGQQAAIAADVIALMDALKIDSAIVAGCDWGARTANIVAALWPERCKALVSVSGYLIGSRDANQKPLPPQAELQWWYQFYFATERGRVGYETYRREFAKLIWQTASPQWRFDDATFDRSAASFDNPDHVSIVIHNYRWRLGLAEGEATYDTLEQPACSRTGHCRADYHARRGRQRGAAPGAGGLRCEVLRQVPTSESDRRDRAQPAARSAASVRDRHHRRGRPVITRASDPWSSRCRSDLVNPARRRPRGSTAPLQ